MAGLRRPPREAQPKKVKPTKFVPIHHQILGKSQIELDNVEDLRDRLETVFEREEIDVETYLACHEALSVRESKAEIGLLKAMGKFDMQPPKSAHSRGKVHTGKASSGWLFKLFFGLAVILYIKFFGLNP